MLSGKNQAGIQPYAYGSLLQASTYGATLPLGYGMTQSPLLAIWAANLRQGGPNSKKGKGGKKGPPSYTENITFAIGHNPIVGVNQMWNNGATIPLAYASHTFTGPGPWTIPDANFYAVIAVSVAETYSASFDDYGGSPVTEAGTYQVPLWNELMTGPDPVRNSGYRNYPYCYKWQPSYGATVQADATDIFSGATVTVYYAQLTAATSFQPPLARNWLHFENVLGDGDEYTGNFVGTSTPLSTQQILYPMYAGAGSQTIDLGSGGVIPQLQAEVQFKWGLYPTGDADFADMIEDIFKSGLAQAALGASVGTAPTTRIEHGLSAYNFPGTVQMKCLAGSSSSSLAPIQYNLAVAEGNFLVVIATTNGSGGGALSISDDAGNSYTSVVSGIPNCQVWYAQANTTGPLTVTVTGQGNSWGTSLIEIGGVDTFDSVSLGVAGVANATTTNAQNFPGYMMSVALYPGATVSQPQIPLWTLLTPTNTYGESPAQGFSIQERRVTTPGVYSASVPSSGLAASLVLAFKCVNPPIYPNPVSDFLDFRTLDSVRIQCRANGLWGSLSMASQQAASDYLATLYQAANSAPVFAGFRLYSMPYSEVSTAANGAIYNAPTAGGPAIKLTTENGDFLTNPPIEEKTSKRVNRPNVMQIQCLNRSSNYNPSVVEQPDQGSIAIYGVRKDDPVQNYAVQDVAIARKLLGISVRKIQYGGDTYKFQLPARWCLLAPMGSGGGGQFVPTPTIGSGGLPALGPGQAVAWSTATIPPIKAATSFISHLPPPDYQAFSAQAGSLTQGVMGVRAGFLFLPTATCSWGGYSLPAGVSAASVQHIYPVVDVGSTDQGGFQQISCSAGGGSFGPGVGGLRIGPDIFPFVGANLNGVTITASVFQSLARDFANMGVSFVGFAIYYLGSAPVPTGTFVADSPSVIDAVLTITDPLAAINEVPVRITSITESKPNGPLDVEAEPFIYGMYSPTPFTTDTPQPSTPNVNISAGDVNAPVIFQPTTGLQGLNNQAQLWLGISSPSINYGGAQVFVSTDGGASYNPLGDPVLGSATTGVLTSSWPAAASPDTTNNLAVDLSESAPVGTLQSYSAATQDGFQYPCYVASNLSPGGYDYELMTYGTATLTATNKYTMQATGGGGNHLNRGVYGAPQQGQGSSHAIGTRFAFLNPNSQGILKTDLPAQWIGKLLYFKICSFNTFNGAVQELSAVTAYPFTPVAAPAASGGAGGAQLFQVNGN